MASKGSPLHGPRIKLVEKAQHIFAETEEYIFGSKAAEDGALSLFLLLAFTYLFFLPACCLEVMVQLLLQSDADREHDIVNHNLQPRQQIDWREEEKERESSPAAIAAGDGTTVRGEEEKRGKGGGVSAGRLWRCCAAAFVVVIRRGR
ncbi:vacuolar protein sorting-associated protein 16 [Datura stramonium]|uniref:Vacuolar protein sorting-associated protein 16 n=1 Tax=Datura stramonium TaxID=4076 RepID=A0ABS8WRV6_DATST|nr:vacuolar protein sorting-associated protein 16 [Datura stramonium]